MSDVTSGRYGQTNPFAAIIGLNNAAQSNIPARSNAEWFGYSTVTDGALAGSGVMCAVPVPIDYGTTVTYVSLIIGATAASTPTHQFAALYAGTPVAAPPLIAQTTDGTTAAVAASGAYSFTFTTPHVVTSAEAPAGFIYVAVSFTGTTVPTAMGVSVPTAVGYQWFTSSTTPKGASPLGLALTSGSSVNGTATATLASPSAKAVAPIVVVS